MEGCARPAAPKQSAGDPGSPPIILLSIAQSRVLTQLPPICLHSSWPPLAPEFKPPLRVIVIAPLAGCRTPIKRFAMCIEAFADAPVS